MADGEGFTEYEYDTLGRPITITLPSGEEVGYRYDNVGNLTWLIYPDGQEAQYQYNEANQLVKVIDWDMQETTYQYDVVGRPVTLTLPNGITTSLTYDDAGNLFSLTHQSITGTIGSYVYEYDNTGRRIGAVETGRVITYTYDALYRLTDAVESTGDVYQYAYDAAGNRLLKVEPGEIVTATYDTANQLLALGGIPVLHDTNGNLVHDGVYTYTYNSLDQLVAVSNGITTTLYGYNGDGDRLWQNTEGVTTTYTLDLNSALAQVLVQTQGGVTTSFLPGIGQKVNDTWTYFHSDALGSVRHLTGPAGQVLGDIRYSPFGEVEDSTGLAPAFGFTGEQQESTLGLVYLRARVYSPALGRFLTPDSIIPDVTNGQSLNAYAYVYNDPVNLVDPSGNIPNVGSAVVDVAKRLPVSWQSRIKEGAAAGLAGLDAWYGRPDSCECSLDPYNSIINHPLTTPSIAGQPFPVTPGIIANTGYQLWWAYKSTPATRIATKTVEKFSVSLTRVSHKVPQLLVDRLWPFVPTRVSLPSLSWGWHVTGQASGSYTFIPSGRYPTGLFKRATIERGPLRIRPGVTGFVGSIAGAGLIDALWQTLIDLGNKCLSPNQRFWRSSTAFGLGLVAGAAGAVAFALLVSFTLPAGVAALGGFVASAGVGYLLNREIKEPYFAANPARYGY